MTERINFEDTLFILMIRLRMIRDTLALDASPDIFLEKTLDDIRFIDRILEILLKYLAENQRLIERADFVKRLSEMEWHFSRLLNAFINGAGNLSGHLFPEAGTQVTLMRSRGQERSKTLDSMEMNGDEAGKSEGPVVSSAEMNELLKDFP
ncbi:MAG: hypothetical protein LBR16_08995 [Treponema sp.]|jgi:hypothetical protein|nr:hypothetical protein [Treponema sp.]